MMTEHSKRERRAGLILLPLFCAMALLILSAKASKDEGLIAHKAIPTQTVYFSGKAENRIMSDPTGNVLIHINCSDEEFMAIERINFERDAILGELRHRGKKIP